VRTSGKKDAKMEKGKKTIGEKKACQRYFSSQNVYPEKTNYTTRTFYIKIRVICLYKSNNKFKVHLA